MTNTGAPKYQTDPGVNYELPDELTQHEIAQALDIMRAIKRRQKGYMLVSPTVGDGRALYIVGPLTKD